MRKHALVRKAASAAQVQAAKGPRRWRLGIVKDLLADLQTATVAGRRFTIEKIVKMLDEETTAARPELSELQRRGLAKALAQLRIEQERHAPRLDAFLVQAERMLWTLASI